MLSPADAALVARDPAIPGLAVLLDPEAFALALRSAAPDAQLGAVEPMYVRYKPGTNCLVAYRVILPAGPTTVYARAYAEALRHKLAHAARLRDEPGAIGVGGMVLDASGIAVYSWPYDPELRPMARLTRPRRRARLLASICPARDDLAEAALVHLRYRPERRYVGRLVGAARGDALLKIYCAGDYEQARAAAGAFRPAGPLDLAAPLASADDLRAMLFAWRPGRALASLIRDDAGDLGALRLAGAALATLHAQPAEGLPRAVAATPSADLAAAAASVAAICPGLAPRVGWLAAGLAATLEAAPPAARPLHGDFYADQVLVGNGQATLLDLDNARWGDPAADLGTFIAHLLRGVTLGRGTTAHAHALARALCEGYAEVAPPPAPEQIGRYSALGLLRLAPEPFRYRAPAWPAQVAALVAAAEDALAGEPGRRPLRAHARGGWHG
ncbi:MAG TPA: phosphotransferase [Chloroflexaceae bacterium]|nr:phosphotransferase [Chloroflexaceae bacterium]